ncbi:MAG: hypothetical protein P0Y64_16335 [Candidatus Sphingomonas colombiensis]|nr:hypothetical protein [Sphingomonas sp.]WEK42893.1 MAG: hypothetical protein P0Y64_16335 [Sphingomonas sp.]
MAVLDGFTGQSAIGEGASFRPLRPSLRFDVHAIALDSRAPSRLASEFLDLLAETIDKMA